MELRQLQYLVDVVEEGSFTKAAARAHVAQPGVSAQIRRLERELGHVLLDRSGGAVRPTDAGAALLPHARAALHAVTDLRQAADALAGLVRGHLTLGMVASISTPRVDLPGLLAGFHRKHPGIEITLTEAPSDQLLGSLRVGELDFAVVGLGPKPIVSGIETRVLAAEPLAVAVSPGHPLAGRGAVTFAALHDHALISLPPGTGLRSHIDAAFAGLGLRPRIAFEAGDPRLLLRLAVQGLGAAVLPASAVDAAPETLRVLDLSQPRVQGRIALAWRSGRPSGPAARAFLDHAERVIPVTEPD